MGALNAHVSKDTNIHKTALPFYLFIGKCWQADVKTKTYTEVRQEPQICRQSLVSALRERVRVGWIEEVVFERLAYRVVRLFTTKGIASVTNLKVHTMPTLYTLTGCSSKLLPGIYSHLQLSW